MIFEPEFKKDHGLILETPIINNHTKFGRLHYHLRSLNSFKVLIESLKAKEENQMPQYVNTDSNLYLTFADLISENKKENINFGFGNDEDETKKKNENNFKTVLDILDHALQPEEGESVTDQYYKALLKHEIDQFYEMRLASRFY